MSQLETISNIHPRITDFPSDNFRQIIASLQLLSQFFAFPHQPQEELARAMKEFKEKKYNSEGELDSKNKTFLHSGSGSQIINTGSGSQIFHCGHGDMHNYEGSGHNIYHVTLPNP